MAYQAVFKRYELKFLLTLEQKDRVLEAITPYMQLDRYGRSSIRNIYFDTDTYRLIRRSIEKPLYKEKLRLRSYGKADKNTSIYVEVKKKFQSVVYKRRIAMTEQNAMAWLTEDHSRHDGSQIGNEIQYFLDFYKTLKPVLFLSYEREAYYATDGSDFRVTFDDNILCRQEALTLDSRVYGTPILPENMVLMEIKCSGGIPLWMTEILSREKLYKTSYSKYGTAYQTILFPQRRAEAQKCEVITND
ncbi:MAG: polyphosphate polymerase domain-containing protein [Oscillospiraceae bacterium]|nr:polyphosphate polymerase domain-containing protein [Oscillospiraceae bacterium]